MKKLHKIEGLDYATGRPLILEMADGKIAGRVEGGEGVGSPVEDADTAGGQDTASKAGGGSSGAWWLAPSLVDLQVNGFKGVDFNGTELRDEDIEKVALDLAAVGVGAFLPTLITGPQWRTSRSLKLISSAVEAGRPGTELVAGIHLEGPFISPEEGPRGAHPLEHCRLPDPALLERWQEEARGLIRLLTLAPELPGSVRLMETAGKLGIKTAIGHSAAKPADIDAAIAAGACLSTHLGNGAHAVMPRHPNYIWEQLGRDELAASMIADGFHLPDAVLRVFARVKGEGGILVSDAMSYAGLEPGVYDSPSTGKVLLDRDGRLCLHDQPATLAGSASTLLRGVEKMSGITGFARAWDMASLHPAALLGQESGLVEGNPADLLVLHMENGRIIVGEVIKNGISIYSKLL